MKVIHELGPFRLDGEAKILFRGTEPVGLGQRALALLQVLVESAGVPVSKDALLEAAWPGLAVEEGNLTVQIAALRRVFGEETGGEAWIETLPRRGYRYVGPVMATQDNGPAAATKMPMPVSLALPDRPSIAVLPFANLSGDLEQEYFADGIVEDIIAGLSRTKWLFVIARNSSFTYKGRATDVKQVGRELGVRYVLEGSVRRAGNRVRVACQLVDAEPGNHLWAERYDRPLDDIFALQDEITLSVIGAIEPSLREAEIERVKRKRPDSLDAYDLVLRALPYVTGAPMSEGARMAMPLLERALALEPNYARAHGLLAWCHEILWVRGGHQEANRIGAIAHARAAIVHGRDDPTALTFGALMITMIEHDRVTAFETFDRALALAPFSALTLYLGCAAAAWAGQAERAIEWGERALRLSPFDQMTYAAHHGSAFAHFLRGRFADAAQAGRRAVQSNPAFSVCHLSLAAPLAALGRFDEARSAAAQVLALEPSFSGQRFCTALDVSRDLAVPLMQAWGEAGLPP